MKAKIYVLLVSILLSCKSLSTQENMEYKVFSYHLGIIENFVENGYTDDDSSLRRSYEFLENITQIKGDVQEQRVLFYTPSIKNLKDWKRWYQKNRDKLYWDEIEQKVKIKEY